MKRNKKKQVRGINLEGKTNQYVHRKETTDDLPNSSQKPLGDQDNVRKFEDTAEQRLKRK
jgi:hypothetical protein